MKPRNSPAWIIAGPALTASLIACAPLERNSLRGMETELSVAGFKVMAADTAEKQKMLHTLPPRTVTRIVRPDNTYYIYADPDLGPACTSVARPNMTTSLDSRRAADLEE